MCFGDFGRRLPETEPNGNTFDYDIYSNATRIEDPEGRIVTRTYTYGWRLNIQTTEEDAGDSKPHVIDYTRLPLGEVKQAAAAAEVSYDYPCDSAHQHTKKGDRFIFPLVSVQSD